MNILDLPMDENDAKAKTIRDYLKALLSTLWAKEEGFSGKRPFGNSGWQWDVYRALVKGGAVKGKIDSEGGLIEHDQEAADKLMQEAIASLQWNDRPPETHSLKTWGLAENGAIE